jgi:hypothetical protein
VKVVKDLVIVEWIDAEADCTWGDMKEVVEWSKKTFHCREVGWVIEDSKEMLVLTSQLGDENLVGNRSKIPQPWIVSKKKISEKGVRR